jgi:dihydroorotate dehydrogenase electron transfer subunit
MIPIVAEVEVTDVRDVGAYRQLTYRHADLAGGTRPGQFVNIAPGNGGGWLRMPFSVAWTDPDARTSTIVFDPIGEGTRWLAAKPAGASLDVVAPLGHGFEVGPGDGATLLVGGGYGTAALVGLAEALTDRGRPVHSILGARTAARLCEMERFEAAARTTTRVTDDGSAGSRGVVTDVLDAVVAEHGVTTIYACGPNPMLAAISTAGRRLGIDTQLAVEEFMACGTGVCWTCVIPTRDGDEIRHERACTEGPVFDGARLAWA